MDLVYSYDREDKICTYVISAHQIRKTCNRKAQEVLRSANNAKPDLGKKYSETRRQFEPVLCIVSSGELWLW